MKFKTPSRAWSAAAKHYVLVVACFLLFAFLCSKLLYLELTLWLRWHDDFIGPIIWALLFTIMSNEFKSMFFPAWKTETHSLYEIGKSEPAHIGEFTKALCTQRKLRMPEIWIDEHEHPFELKPGAAHDSLFFSNVVMISRMFSIVLPPPLMRALIAHELRHLDSSINLFSRVMRILVRVSEMLLLAFVINFFFIALIRQGSFSLAALTALLGLLTISVYGRLNRYLLGVMSRSREHYTDILAAGDTGDHQSLIHLLYSLDDISLARNKMLQRAAEYHHKMRKRFMRMTSSVEEETAPKPRHPLWRRILRWPWITCRIFVLTLYYLPSILMFLLLSVLHLSWREFPSHPSAAVRKAVLDAVFGPSEPWQPASFELPDDHEPPPPFGGVWIITE